MEHGYCIVDIDINPFIRGFLDRISFLIEKRVDSLHDYHNLVSDEQHQRITITERWMILDDDMIREIRKSTGLTEDLKADNLTLNLPQEFNVCSWFIVRPQPHKDFITKLHSDRDNLGSKYNIWIPLSGFGKKYSLSIVPDSHKDDNTRNATKIVYDTASYQKIPDRDDCIRPDVKRGQGILFNSNLVHGNAYNDGTDTRVSLEVRFYENRFYNT